MADELRCYRAMDGARFTLVCFPHAGGNATAFRDWPAYLPEDVAVYAVRYPGRLDRSHEPPARAVGEITGPVARTLGEVPGRLVLFGHSMGAVLAHQVAVNLEAAYRFPAALVVSGREAPHLTDRAPSLVIFSMATDSRAVDVGERVGRALMGRSPACPK